MNALANLLTIVAFLATLSAGVAAGWIYRDRAQSIESNAITAAHLAAIENAAPAIALQVQSLQRAATESRRLNDELENNASALRSITDCPVPASLHSLSVERTEAINANAAGQNSAELPKSRRD